MFLTSHYEGSEISTRAFLRTGVQLPSPPDYSENPRLVAGFFTRDDLSVRLSFAKTGSRLIRFFWIPQVCARAPALTAIRRDANPSRSDGVVLVQNLRREILFPSIRWPRAATPDRCETAETKPVSPAQILSRGTSLLVQPGESVLRNANGT
jgi:hypothetical protein